MRPTSPLFHFLTHIQDEVHRFAVSFHRQKRSKDFIHSELERIEGVGERTIRTLLRHFRTVEKVRTAPAEELSALVGPAKAKKILAYRAVVPDFRPPCAVRPLSSPNIRCGGCRKRLFPGVADRIAAVPGNSIAAVRRFSGKNRLIF